MRKAILPIACLLLVGTLLLYSSRDSTAATATHLVISEIQVGGTGDVDKEFVELYNPTDSAVVLDNMRLIRKNSTGSTTQNLVASLSGTMQPHKYFLVANPAYASIPVTPDMVYSASSSAITNDSSITLLDTDHTTVVDLVGLGSATSSESTTVVNPALDGSVERKAQTLSDATSMGSGGADELMGNGEDTNNNANDFVVSTASQPQNSLSAVEFIVPTPTPVCPNTFGCETPTPTNTPTAIPSPTPTNTPTPTPTEIPSPTPTETPTPTLTPTPTNTPTPTPSATPSPTPTNTPSPTPTLTPTVTPTVTVTITVTPTPTATSTVAPSPTAIPTVTPTVTQSPTPTGFPPISFPHFQISCQTTVKIVVTRFFTLHLPIIRCTLVRV